MTIYEHAMIGINGALAAGLHRRHGWPIIAWAGIAATIPDADGMTILFGFRCYAEGHRLWGHNLLIVGIMAVVASGLIYKTDALVKIQNWLAIRWSLFRVSVEAKYRGALWLWMLVGVLAVYSHLMMDVAYSSGKNLPMWGVPLFWPFSDKPWAYPMICWGDVGATLILAVSMFAMLRWPQRIREIATASLFAVAVYMCLSCRLA